MSICQSHNCFYCDFNYFFILQAVTDAQNYNEVNAEMSVVLI